MVLGTVESGRLEIPSFRSTSRLEYKSCECGGLNVILCFLDRLFQTLYVGQSIESQREPQREAAIT